MSNSARSGIGAGSRKAPGSIGANATLATGLDELHFHDLRGTSCTLLAEAGATASEIAAVLGWTVTTVNQMLDSYQAMTASLSDSAVAELERKAL